ncbi:DUF1801 domain-containing protein [Microbacterium stercoris]|uniref:DUF1801 domain-containing protein n=1 Tax=Microbacterium stercoris TaxID=2820289 RepID=UPI0027DC335A|nr:DUF1801 domain-containing protein [Microbacterium stercoris]
MRPGDGDLGAFLSGVTPAQRRTDAETVIDLMREVSGREPRLWGSIVGFGSCHYVYPTGTEGDVPVLSFAPRKAATTLYLSPFAGEYPELLAALGPHTTSVACLYIKKLAEVDLDVLRALLRRSLAWVEAGGDERMRITVTG